MLRQKRSSVSRKRVAFAVVITAMAVLAVTPWVAAQNWNILAPENGSKYRFGIDGENWCDIGVNCHDVAPSWSITPIAGSTVSYDPGNPMHQGVIRYTNLPVSNLEFGNKTVTATHGGQSQTRQVQIFYVKDAQNHGNGPGSPPEAAFWPNWYHYWRYTTASYGTYQYDVGLALTGQTRFENGQWRAFIGPEAAYGPVGTPPDYMANGATGIDLFANVCRHEAQHVLDYGSDWGVNTNRDPSQDGDGDWLKDSLESAKVAGHPGGYNPLDPDTYVDHFFYGAGWSDDEDWALHRQPAWTNGSANTQDWSAGEASKQWP